MKTQFNLFRDIQHRPLRIYNRSVMFHNLYEDQGAFTAQEYADAMNKEERLEVAQMTALVKKIGPKKVKELVTAGVDFVDDEYREGGV